MESESLTEIAAGTSAGRSETEFGLSLLASTLAHEIRNPLQTIRLQLDVAKRGGSFLAVLQKIGENITRLESVVDRVQQLSHRYVLQTEKVSLKEVLDATLSTISFWLAASGIQVRSHIDWEGEPICEVDKELLQQVLLNLLMNSIQAMPNGGSLTVCIIEELDHALFQIEDTGVGIPADALKMVGTPFYTTKVAGNGLGLAFCKTIAALHHGSLEVESKVDVGTKISLRISKNTTEENVNAS